MCNVVRVARCAGELQSRTPTSAAAALVGLTCHEVQVDTVAGLASDHLHRREAEGEGVKPRPRMVRVGKELASLSVSVFCHRTHPSHLHAQLLTRHSSAWSEPFPWQHTAAALSRLWA